MPDHEVVPVAEIQFVPSVLISTLSTATLSEVVPVTVTEVDANTAPGEGDVIAMSGGIVSGTGATTTFCAAVSFSPSSSVTLRVTVYVPAAV